jgi:hypothetical protein
MFFVSVAFKRLRYSASSLFATHRRGLTSVASKQLRLHQNCAEFGHFRCFFRPGRNLPDRTANGRSALRANRGIGRGRVGRSGAQRGLREAGGETNRANWRLTIKGDASTDVM